MKCVFTNGCYDSLTHAHIKLFQYAKSLGDMLIVAIDSDERVRLMKGYGRPFHTQEQRKFNLNSIRYIDLVLVFNDAEELEKLIEKWSPDFLVIGREYENKKVVGGQFAKEIRYFDKVDSPSSTILINGK